MLYLLLAGEVALELANTWIRGDSTYTFLQIAALDPEGVALKQAVAAPHQWRGHLILVLAGLHAAAPVLHHFVLRDGVLRRMTLKDK